MQHIIIFILLLSTAVSAGIYDEYSLTQDTNKSQNYFFSNDFEEIIRFDAIFFEEDSLSTQGRKTLEDISEKINLYKNGKRNFYISIIGHTSVTTDDKNENKIDSNSYANKIQNMFRDSFSKEQSQKASEAYAKKIEKYLIEHGVDKNIIELEYRSGLDPLFSNETSESKALSNRVMVSLYVEENLDLDDDGVVNSRDFCPKTKKGTVVDSDGCKFKSIILLAKNSKDHNAILVSTKKSTRAIETPMDYTYVKSENDALRLYKSMSNTKMNAIFGDVLATNNVTKFTIYFNNTDFVDGDAQFAKIVNFLANREDSYIQIIGHTDSKGTSLYNEKLAKTRAEIVAQKIKESGVKYLYIQVESYGEYNLAVQTADGVSEALNRRVEVLIR